MKTKTKKKLNVVTLGCSKNIVDSEALMSQLKSSFDVTHESTKDDADIVIINTCGFINDAKQESIDTILSYANAKKEGKIKKVYVMGCLSQRYKEELSKEIPEVDGYFGVNDFAPILNELGIDYKKELLGERLLTTPKHYAYLKIAEGCNRKCSFCAIPLIRGNNISRTIESLIEEAEWLVSNGTKEIILIAQDLTYYGMDIYKKRKLAELLEKLAVIKGLEWIRLHYAYPAAFPMNVIDVMKEHPNICKYLDIPLQHISDDILKSMKRNITGAQTKELIRKIRAKVPDIAIRTTLITGYPGETVKEFNDLKKFIIESMFERLGVFAYSPEENTSAYKLKDSIPQKIKQQRLEELMALQQGISADINQARVGNIYKVIIDRKEGEHWIGRTEYDSPEVDNEVLIPINTKGIKQGNFYNIKINKADDYDLYGEISA